jgi:membrane associated rhomboid family serine protease
VIEGLPGALVYGFVLLIVDLLTRSGAFGFDWLRAGSAHAELIQQGQWWRCLTALTLHTDAAHLLGNLAFGSLFGLLASQVWGSGAAWLAIVVAGTLGNAVNGVLYGPGHISVGASTAVFATWGMLTVHALWHRRDSSTRVRRWAPLAGGLALLAFLGTAGERTDVLAHLAGFVAGCLVGALMIQVPAALIAPHRAQIAAAAACLAAVILAWVVALAN